MKKGHSIKDMQVIAGKHGGRCLSKEYVGSKALMTWQCALGHEPFEATYNNVSKGHWCSKCAGNKKKTIVDMEELAAAHGGKCLSTDYVNSKTKLIWQCDAGHEPFSMRPNNVQQGQWCPECGGVKKLTLEDLNKLAANHGGRCLSKTFKNNRSIVTWECELGHRFKRSPNNVQQGQWCGKCIPSENKKRSIKEIQKMARDRGGELLSTEYSNNKTKLHWRCAEGHEFWKRLNTVQQRLSWCTECKINFREQYVRECFEQLFNQKFLKSRPKWLSNLGRQNMELDGYNKKLGLAFEHHGIQHYETVPYFHRGDKDIERQETIDEERRVLCREQNVLLIEVPYFIPIDEVNSFILTELDNNHFDYPTAANRPDPSPDSIYVRTEIARLREAASEFGHTLISKTYKGSDVPLVFRCSRGHEFPRRPGNFHGGQTNCPTCVGVKKKTIKDMQIYAESRGAVCISTTYVNNKRSLAWHCLIHDHHFQLPWNKVQSMNRWCKFCKLE